MRTETQQSFIDITIRQVRQNGYLSMQDFHQLTGSGLPLISIVQEKTGESKDDIFERIKDGKFTQEEFLSLIKDE